MVVHKTNFAEARIRARKTPHRRHGILQVTVRRNNLAKEPSFSWVLSVYLLLRADWRLRSAFPFKQKNKKKKAPACAELPPIILTVVEAGGGGYLELMGGLPQAVYHFLASWCPQSTKLGKGEFVFTRPWNTRMEDDLPPAVALSYPSNTGLCWQP